MLEAVNDYLEASGANRTLIGDEETILAHRKIAANRRTKHGQSVEQCSNTMPCKEEEEDTQPTNEAWAEYRAILEHYAMQGGGRGHLTDWRLLHLCFVQRGTIQSGQGVGGDCGGFAKAKGWYSQTVKPTSPHRLLCCTRYHKTLLCNIHHSSRKS